MWDLYTLTMQIDARLCGSVPQSKELIRPWLEARKPTSVPAAVREGTAPTLDDLAAEVAATVETNGIEERITLGFQRDGNGLFVRSGTVKAHLKDCANQIQRLVGVKAFRSKVANAVFVEPDRIALLRATGELIADEDGEFERPVHVMTPIGPRNALKRIRYVEQPVLTCTLRVLRGTEATVQRLRTVLEYGGVHGYGGERGMGEGRYSYTLVGKPDDGAEVSTCSDAE